MVNNTLDEHILCLKATYLVEKGNIEWAETLAEGQHLLLEPLEVDLLDDFMRFTLPLDETHEYSFLQRM